MSQGVKSLLALVGAVGLVVAAIVVRGALDEKEVQDAIRVRLVCDAALDAACRKAADADSRIELTVERPDQTRARLLKVEPGGDPGLDAWVTIGPWMALTDGARTGRAPLRRSGRDLASAPIALVGRQDTVGCPPRPEACASNQRTLGSAQPTQDGVALAGIDGIVTGATGIPIPEIDRATLETGAAADIVRRLKLATRPVGLEAVNTNFSTAGVVVTTSLAAAPLRGRPGVVIAPLPVRAVVEVAFLREDATVPLAPDSSAGQALQEALQEQQWEGPQPSGLPDPGVLAALQETWARA